MTRQEFSTAVKVRRFKHCGGRCEAIINGNICNALLIPGRYHVDHDTADGLGGKPTFENARCICLPCHADKTKTDVAAIAKAKRREARAVGAVAPKKAIASRGFPKRPDKPNKIDKAALGPLPLPRLMRGPR